MPLETQKLTYEASTQLPASDRLCRSQSQPPPITIESLYDELTKDTIIQGIEKIATRGIHPEASEIILLVSDTTNSVASDTTSSVALALQHQIDILIQSWLTLIVATILLVVFGGLTFGFAMNITSIFPLLLASNLEEIHPEASEIILFASDTTNNVASDTTSSVALASQHQSTLLSQHLRNTSFDLNCSDVLIQSRLTLIVATILLERT
ncbi:hypothetical protein H5410_023559 [Solanum commersonii]|uniref:Uncharacterized protein n=1 Tax=Solanum commersonii TaxID=4109 RepID=A0A9J5ZK37_SOLCO|nr:hypothetical protein H5410_023559 [Solanum commersonii]